MEVEDNTPTTGDMILRQPDFIVNEILTHLDLTNLVRTSLLSKPWRYLWITSSPNLSFDYEFFNPLYLNLDLNQIRAKHAARILFVEQTLGIRSSSSCCCCLEKLGLDTVRIYSQSEIICLDNCIRYAIACDLKRLRLKVTSPVNLFYVLPPTLFGHRGLVELYLDGCMLMSLSFPSDTSLSCLKVLLIRCSKTDSTKLVEDLIACCPLLQDLTLAFCYDFSGILNIAGNVNNPKLINVKITGCSFERIEIDAPGLQSFTFQQSTRRAPCVFVISSCKNIKELELWNIDNASAFENNSFDDLLSRLLYLESMVLCNCNMETLKISSSILKRLKLIWCKKLVKVEIDNPNLSLFRYVGKNMIYFASNALDLSVDITLLAISSNVDTSWFIEFVEFLGRFNTAKALALGLYKDAHKNVIVPRKLRASLLPPLYNVEHLVLQIEKESLTQTIDELFDGLLWLSPHPVTVSFASYGKKILELTFLYDEIDGEGKYCDCFSSLITCWRHCLKEVKIKNLGIDEDEVEKNINSFFDHAIILRKFKDL